MKSIRHIWRWSRPIVPVALAVALVVGCAAPAAPTATSSPSAKPSAVAVGEAAKPTILAAGTAIPSVAAQTQPNIQKITLILDWFPNTNHSGLYAAISKGFFAANGIEVDIQAPSDPSASMKLVGAGKAELGISYQPAVEIARAQDIPVVSVAAILQHNTAAYAVKADKGITRPKEFEGKKFGTSGLAQVEPTLRTFMQCDGGDLNKVEMINIGQKLSPALLSDQVDVISMLPAWEGIELEGRGNKLKYFPQTQFCVPDLYTLVFIAGEQTIAEKPDVVRRFLAGASQGYEYAVSNPAEVAEILIKASPELDPNTVRKSQAVLSTQYKAEAPRWGFQTAEKWQKHIDWMVTNKLIARPVDASKAFTNEFLPKP